MDLFATPETSHPLWHEDFTYIPNFLDTTNTLEHDLDWETHHITMFGKTHPLPRRLVMYGGAYTYAGITHPARAFPPSLQSIQKRVEAHTKRSFNSCLCNLYRNGKDSVSWHSDADYKHGGQAWIASISLGQTRNFRLRHKTTKETFTLPLEHGSLLLMKSFAQDNWEHQIPKTTRQIGPRVNLTFRHIVA